MMDFLNKEVLELFGYKIYPLFFILVIIALLIMIASIVIMGSKKDKIPKEAKVKGKGKRKDVKDSRIDILDGVPENDYNLISSWQKENLKNMLLITMDEYRREENVEDDAYTNTIESLINYIENNKYWSVADLVEISPNAVLFLTMLAASELENEIHDFNIDRTVLFSNAIDRMNGTFEQGGNPNREWISNACEAISSNYQGPESGKRLLGCIINSLETVLSVMDDGIIPEGIPYTDNNLDMVTRADLARAINELKESENFILNISNDTQMIVLYSLIFKLRHQIDNLIQLGKTQTIRPLDFNIVRAITIMADKQDYSDIISEFLD